MFVISGLFPGRPDQKGYLSRYINWQYSNSKVKCHGLVVRHVCIFSALDLPTLGSSIHLAANKFDLNFDPVAYACMEERVLNYTRDKTMINMKPFQNLYWVHHDYTKQDSGTEKSNISHKSDASIQEVKNVQLKKQFERSKSKDVLVTKPPVKSKRSEMMLAEVKRHDKDTVGLKRGHVTLEKRANG